MIFKIFLLFLLNHIIFDFAFQGESIIRKRFPKEVILKDIKDLKKKIRVTIEGNTLHSLLHLIGMVGIIVGISIISGFSGIFLLKAVVISVSHFIIDEGKSLIFLYKNKYRNNMWIFLGDQLVHVLVLILVMLGMNNLGKITNYTLDNIDKILITVIVFLTVTLVTGIFIKIFINDLMEERSSSDAINIIAGYSTSTGAKNGGFIIGILERILIFISMLIEYHAIIGFILTAKSIARFNKLSDQRFAEYFIIGNLISFTSAIVGGVLIKYLFGI